MYDYGIDLLAYIHFLRTNMPCSTEGILQVFLSGGHVPWSNT